eukprot:5939977-Prymnesium_polylepis.1
MRHHCRRRRPHLAQCTYRLWCPYRWSRRVSVPFARTPSSAQSRATNVPAFGARLSAPVSTAAHAVAPKVEALCARPASTCIPRCCARSLSAPCSSCAQSSANEIVASSAAQTEITVAVSTSISTSATTHLVVREPMSNTTRRSTSPSGRSSLSSLILG